MTKVLVTQSIEDTATGDGWMGKFRMRIMIDVRNVWRRHWLLHDFQVEILKSVQP
jgi:hypothetical protein